MLEAVFNSDENSAQTLSLRHLQNIAVSSANAGNLLFMRALNTASQSYERSKKRLAGEKLNVSLIRKALWDKEETLLLKEHPTGDSAIVSNNEEGSIIKIEATSLDSFFADKEDKPTFIKMDIEGAELKALMGAEQIIRHGKPKLAICVYHKAEDLFTIPQLILKFNQDYKIYLRKYPSKLAGEFIMYFI